MSEIIAQGWIIADAYRREQFVNVRMRDRSGQNITLDMRAGQTQNNYRRVRQYKGTDVEIIVSKTYNPHTVLEFVPLTK